MLGVDAARGAAMFFSCLAHFGWWIEPAHPVAERLLTTIGMIATPTFLLLSGTVTGWLCATAARDPPATRIKLLNRGLFLLTAGHLLISLAEAHRSGSLLRTIAGATIIDDIGFCMLCCAAGFSWLQHESFRRPLVRYGICAYLACWMPILLWHPSANGWLVLRQALFDQDPLGGSVHSYASPTIPYLCLFLVGLGLSDRLVAAARDDAPAQRRELVTIGCLLICMAALCRVAQRILDTRILPAGGHAWADVILNVGGKLPPSPAYVLAYGGAGLVISAAIFALASSKFQAARVMASMAATVGRASLFVFVLQYFIYWTLPDLVGISPVSRHTTLIFMAGLCLNWLAAWMWGRIRGNRFLTLGIPARPSRNRGGRSGPAASIG